MNRWMRRTAAGLLATCALFLGACSGGDDAPAATPAPTPTGTVAGRVLASADAAPLAGATVSVGALSTRTAADGSYTLADVPVSARAVVKVAATGHVQALLTTAVVASENRVANASLLAEATAVQFDAASAATLTTAGTPARVDLPAASLVNASTGAAASGTVSGSVTPIDPARDPFSMPGDYTVSDTVRIESFGAIQVNLRDAAGNRLQLRPGSLATIRIPLASRSATPPASVPLYYFDEATGRWVQQGSATLAGTAPGQYYEGQVSHFSYWNADQEQDTIYVNGCVVDDTGQRIGGAVAQSLGLDYSGTGVDVTNSTGNFRVPIRKGGVAAVHAELGTGLSTNTVVVGPSQVDITLPACLVLASGPVAPQVVQPPVAFQAEAGGPAFFSAVATGTRPLTYQWQRNGVHLAGATSDALVLRSTSAADAGTYTVVVRNAAGTVTSAGAVLTVSTPVAPAISLQPAALTVGDGETASFTVLANGTGPLVYQWQRDGVDITGATAATHLTRANTQADNGARYQVLVSNSLGSVLSSAAVLTVRPPALVAPSISLQPLDAQVQAGGSASFSVVATGNPAPRLQWQRNGVDIAGATGASHTTPALMLADSGATYSVQVSNSQGSVVSRSALLTVSADDSAQKLQLLRLLSLSMDFYEAASTPLLLTDATGAAFASPAAVCSTGSISGSFNGGALPAPGTALPPSGTLAANATACEVDGTTHTGNASVRYNLSSLEPPVGSATATVAGMRLVSGSGSNVTRDITANGGGTVILAGTVAGGQRSGTVTFAPAAGASLLSGLSGLTATFNSGSVAVLSVENLTTNLPARSRVTYNDLRFSVAGVAYVATGFYEISFSAQGAFSGGAGEVVLSSGGVVVGRVYANAQGVFLEVNGISQPFAAPRRSLAR